MIEYDVNIDCSYDGLNNDVSIQVSNGHHDDFRIYLERKAHIARKEIYHHLQAGLVEYI